MNDAVEEQRIQAAIELAAIWLRAVEPAPRQARRRRRLARLVTDDAALALSVGLADAVLRIPQPARSARAFASLLRRTGIPRTMPRVDQLSLRVGGLLAPRLPRVVMPLVHRRVRRESSSVILPAESGPLGAHLARRRTEGFAVNVNVLGEAILGEREAARRLAHITSVLQRPDVFYISVKVSAVVTQLDPLAFDDSVNCIIERLRPLFRAATTEPPKFINLDMEEYRDLELTVAAFTRLLDESEFAQTEAGIVLQAYLPDAHDAFERLSDWSARRHQRSGASIKVRIVKGANLAMERVEAEGHGWHAAPYATKADVDASYKRLVDRALQPSSTVAVRIGIASHNLFDIAWALLLARERGVLDRVEFEMLEGMASDEAAALLAETGAVRLYTPITRRQDRTSATAYLIRRMDENTTPGNFLREAFALSPQSPAFAEQADLFRVAVRRRATLTTQRRRGRIALSALPFQNEPDSDFVLSESRSGVLKAIAAQRRAPIETVPVAVFGQSCPSPPYREWFDPSEPDRLLFQHPVVTIAVVDAAVCAAQSAVAQWSRLGPSVRAKLLGNAADTMAADRFHTISTMVIDCAKTVAEADPEVSEAIDFARFYAHSAVQLASEVTCVVGHPLGVVLIAPPWNFPYAIAAGGVLAALAAGNTVLLKPAPEAVRVGWLLCQQLWRSGVPKDVLQFLPCDDDAVGRHLVTHDGIAAVILTGGFATAQLFTSWKPELHLLAETSGKNAIIVTAAADIDAAVHDMVRSAFGHAGQKCSAASLAIVEADVYDSQAFQRQLHDAVSSLRIGPAWQTTTSLGPVILPPAGSLLRALTELDQGESWLVQPAVDPGNPRLWSAGVKMGVAPDSWSHQTEWFGPVLAVMRAPDLDTALNWLNGTAYGLTAGIHSLDPDECELFVRTAQAGNLYVNRHITGAVVQRQPFGGWKRSALGPGAKAGGPNYVAVLQQWVPTPQAVLTPPDSTASYERWWRDHFSQSHDPSGLTSERNVLRYCSLRAGIVLRIGEGQDVASIVALARTASALTGTRVTFSVTHAQAAIPGATVESDETLRDRITPHLCDRLRLIGPVEPSVRLAAIDAGVQVDDSPLMADGRIELLRWVREQAISITSHRYGTPVPPSQAIRLG